MMNNKAQTAIVGIMLGFLIVITVLAISQALKDQVTTSRTNLDCTNTSLSAGATGTCIIVDWMYPGFVGIGLMVGISYVLIRRLVTQNSGGGNLN